MHPKAISSQRNLYTGIFWISNAEALCVILNSNWQMCQDNKGNACVCVYAVSVIHARREAQKRSCLALMYSDIVTSFWYYNTEYTSAVAPAITWGLVIVLARKWRKVVCLSIAFECLYKRYAISNVLCVQITLYYANQRAAVSQLMSQDWAKITENVRYCFLYPVM